MIFWTCFHTEISYVVQCCEAARQVEKLFMHIYIYIYVYVYTAWPAYVTSVMICFVLSCSTGLHNWFQYTDTRPEGHWTLLMDTRDLKSKTSKDILFKRTLSQDRIIILVYILSFIPLMNTDRICFSTTYFILFYYITLYIPVKSSNIIYINFNVDYSIFRTIITTIIF